ncbi:serine hydrolase domain-containing protein [Marilutibacter spongiae]|uniref:Beta-lactamase family protein n=1 Tax=Marilutibacter spongiae TaxID=2025720 RepID=A0A7W3TJL0_9GAMM|nr:serine hydrolase domain-containing protein [Lysobacter spongiae]MBB1059542.1 beta-lactamase family protein [Lysobacter spongiae]
MPRMPMIVLLVAASFVASFSSPSAAGPGERDAAAIAHFDAYLAAFREEHRIPALAVAVLRDGRPLWAKAYGWSDDEAEVEATIDTTFSIASVTKPIAAAAIIAEAEAGALDLDTPMAADPDWADTCDWLSHSEILFGSGGREADGTPVPAMDCTRGVTLRDMLNMRANGDGSQFVYNPVSYARIDRVISGAGGRDLRAIVRERMIDPAGIHDLALGWRDPQGGSALRLLAPPFEVVDGKRRKNNVSDDDFRAAAGIKASVRQLAQFDAALDAGRLLPEGWHARIFDAPVEAAAGDYRWGWFAQEWRGERLLWHSGWDPGRYSAMYLKVPERSLTLIVLANTEALWWDNSAVRAEIETSPVAATFLADFAGLGAPATAAPDAL